jgi:hypothetical protein
MTKRDALFVSITHSYFSTFSLKVGEFDSISELFQLLIVIFPQNSIKDFHYKKFLYKNVSITHSYFSTLEKQENNKNLKA